MPDLIEIFGGHFMSELADPYPVYARLRRENPAVLVDLPLGPGYIVTRYSDVLAVLRDATLFSSRSNAKGIGFVMGRTILEMDGPTHARHRNLVQPAFMPRSLLGEMPGVVERIAHSLIDGFARDGRADLVGQFTKTFPLRVMAHIIGLPIEDYDTFQRWALAIIGLGSDPAAAMEAARLVVEYLKPIAELRRREPREDLLSKLVHAEVDGQRLDDEEVMSFLRLLIPAGAETTYRLIGNTLLALLQHPEQLDEVRAERARVDLAIDESLRWEAPVCFASRQATAPTEIAGVPIPEGAGVMVALSSANRDEAKYPDPARFDIHRGADDHVAFGFGRHFCVGVHLARFETRIALGALFDRLPNLRLAPDEADLGVYGLAFRSPRQVLVRFDA
jgi:cytochrome P450